MSDEDFSNAPVSITEAKADRAQGNGGAVWTPRDALIAALRALDSGEINPYTLVVVYAERPVPEKDWLTCVRYFRATPDHLTFMGMMHQAMHEAQG